MSVIKSESELNSHKTAALGNLEKFIDSLISSDGKKQADLLCYWIDDYVRFLQKESAYDPKKGRKYQRGDIVKAHLGFRIGSEEGGLHYCVVLDKDNPLSSPVLTVVPLTSIKNTSSINDQPKGNIYLGNEIHNSLILKTKTLLKLAKTMSNELKETRSNDNNPELEKRITQLEKFVAEIKRMKRGSIALTNQVVTISKLRIYDPKSDDDILSGIKLSNTNLDKIDEQILCNYTNIKS